MLPTGWALQKPQQTIEPSLYEAMMRRGDLVPLVKHDGNRGHILTGIGGAPGAAGVRITSRNGTLDWTGKLPHLVEQAAALPEGLLVDCELIAPGEGTTAFQELMNGVTAPAIAARAFDLLTLDGALARRPYAERRARLIGHLGALGADDIAPADVFTIDGRPPVGYDATLEAIERAGIEGIVAWKASGVHVLNTNGNTKRGEAWKVKVRATEDLIAKRCHIAGDPALGVGSLELHRRGADGRLTPVGKVGSFEKAFDRIAAVKAAYPFVVEVSHYGEDEAGRLTFAKIVRARPDLHADLLEH